MFHCQTPQSLPSPNQIFKPSQITHNSISTTHHQQYPRIQFPLQTRIRPAEGTLLESTITTRSTFFFALPSSGVRRQSCAPLLFHDLFLLIPADFKFLAQAHLWLYNILSIEIFIFKIKWSSCFQNFMKKRKNWKKKYPLFIYFYTLSYFYSLWKF